MEPTVRAIAVAAAPAPNMAKRITHTTSLSEAWKDRKYFIINLSSLFEEERWRADINESRHQVLFTAYRLTKDKFVDVMSKHGAGWEEAGVCWRHDSGRHCTQSHKRHSGWCEILKHHGEDQCLVEVNRSCLVGYVTTGWLIEVSLAPI